jgi:hypothetical protein
MQHVAIANAAPGDMKFHHSIAGTRKIEHL